MASLHHGGYPCFCIYDGGFSVKSILLKTSSQNSLVVPGPLIKPRCVKSAQVSKLAQAYSHLHKCHAHFLQMHGLVHTCELAVKELYVSAVFALYFSGCLCFTVSWACGACLYSQYLGNAGRQEN